MMTGDIARLLGCSRQYVVQTVVHRKDFPEPYGLAGDVRVWLASDVEKWAKNRQR